MHQIKAFSSGCLSDLIVAFLTKHVTVKNALLPFWHNCCLLAVLQGTRFSNPSFCLSGKPSLTVIHVTNYFLFVFVLIGIRLAYHNPSPFLYLCPEVFVSIVKETCLS